MAFERKYKIGSGRPTDYGRRIWDEMQRSKPLVEEDGGQREQPGLAPIVRNKRFEKWAYCFVTPDMLQGTPPPEVLVMFEEILGEWIRDEAGALRLRIAFHPLMKRWCTYHMVRRPDAGEAGTLWQVIFIHSEDPVPGYLPSDLNAHEETRHFTGMVGDYSLPTRKDFEAIRNFGARDPKMGTIDERLGRLSEQLNAKERAIDAEMYDRGRDIADYTANYEIDQANRRAGTGWHMRSAFTDGKSTEALGNKDGDKYLKTEKDGYTVIERRHDVLTRAERAKEMAKAILSGRNIVHVDEEHVESLMPVLAEK